MNSLLIKLCAILSFFALCFIECKDSITQIKLDGVDVIISKENGIKSSDQMQMICGKDLKKKNKLPVGMIGYILYTNENISEISKIENKKRTIGYTILLKSPDNNSPKLIKAEIDKKDQENDYQLILKKVSMPKNAPNLEENTNMFMLFVSKGIK